MKEKNGLGYHFICIFIALVIIFVGMSLINGTDMLNNPIAEEPSKPDLEILEHSSESDGYFRYAVGYVRNNSDKTIDSIYIEINMYDENGILLGFTNDSASYLKSGDVWKYKAIVTEEDCTNIEIAELTGY